MKDYAYPFSMDVPMVESPFFNQYRLNASLSDSERTLLWQYNTRGYVVVDLGLTDDFINRLMARIYHSVEKSTVKTQEGGYHYSESPRVFEAWKDNPYVLALAKHEKILSTLKLLYQKNPIPFQTINFIKGSNQPLHQDSIHFYTEPQRWMAGVWVALEDITEDNGALEIVPYSHKLPHYDFASINLPPQKYGEQFEAYAEYENFLKQLVPALGLKKEKWLGKKGQAIIWASNLLHGGAEIVDAAATRHSQAIHYYFEDCKHYYSPMFSDVRNGVYAEKDLSQKDILNHVI